MDRPGPGAGPPHDDRCAEVAVANVFAEGFAYGPCNDALDAHFGTTPPTTRVDVEAAGFGQPGDSLLILDGASIGATVSAPAETSVFYLCALHPWMQGSLRVG